MPERCLDALKDRAVDSAASPNQLEEGMKDIVTEEALQYKSGICNQKSCSMMMENKHGSKFESELADSEEGLPQSSKESQNFSIKRTVFVRFVESMARNPWKHLLVAVTISSFLSVVGMVAGKFTVAADNNGWQARGTKISDRQTQVMMVKSYQEQLFNDVDNTVWNDLQNNVQPGWQKENMYGSQASSDKKNLWSIWKTDPDMNGPSIISALDSNVFSDICAAETDTLLKLQKHDLCPSNIFSENASLLPFSLVTIVRHYLNGGLTKTCTELSTLWPTIKDEITGALVKCVEDVKLNYNDGGANRNVTSCPIGFSPSVVDTDFGADNLVVRYTSSYFQDGCPSDNVDAIYKIVNNFDRADGKLVLGTYETTDEGLSLRYIDNLLNRDARLAMISALITVAAIIVHTGSLWLTVMGLVQILLSFPLAYFVYVFILGLKFFPFLNLLGVFVVFAIGADDIFVATDKWKNKRIQMEGCTTEEVAAHVLPNAASATLLTTATTAGAFFGTAICPVAPMFCFAVFCGLLIVMDYITNIFIIFPSLCIYDKWLLAGRHRWYITFKGRKQNKTNLDGNQTENTEKFEDDDVVPKQSLISEILSSYFKLLHSFRYLILILSLAAIIVCSIIATNLGLPASSEVRLIDENHQFELNHVWKQNLLSSSLQNTASNNAYIIWGVTPADTGDLKDPESWSTLNLDNSFHPGLTDAQSYLVGFCDRIFDTDFAIRPSDDYECPINKFDTWLEKNSKSSSPDEAYKLNCNNATSIPMAEDQFDACIIAWSKDVEETSILEKNGAVKIMIIESGTSAHWASPHDVLEREWQNFETWLENERVSAPEGVNGMFHSSFDFWLHDTNSTMLNTAYGAGTIALIFAAVVVLVSSRSLVMTFFSVVSIGYVLVATIACLVGLGWELGFLEAICMAILIGISCDFVIHFSHAYTVHPGQLSKHERAKYALLHMGPSVLAAAATTFSSAIVMFFCKIYFFQKFGMILVMTILHSTIGTFVIFLAMADCFGPSEPTKLVDRIIDKMRKCFTKKPHKRSSVLDDSWVNNEN